MVLCQSIRPSDRALGARPEDCLMVGDSAADMEAGKRAGVRTCAVRYGYGDPGHLARCWLLVDPSEIEAAVDDAVDVDLAEESVG